MERYHPSLWRKVFVIVSEQVVCLFYLIIGAIPYLWDVFKTRILQSKENRLPSNMNELLDVKMFSRLSGKKVVHVEYADRSEQHANSTDRAWFKVKYENEDNECFIFAKMQAKTLIVCAIMSIYDIYRNELHTYQKIKIPIITPKVHIAKWTRSRFILAMEDLRIKDVEFPCLWKDRVDITLGKKVLSGLSKIHAKFWNNPPDGIWNDKTRPYMPRVQGLLTLYNVKRQCKDLISDEMFSLFSLAMWNFDKLRAFYSRKGLKTMIHGDSHIGNFYITKSGDIGAFDFQCVAEEHPMRDVTYFLISSFPENLLEENEKDLIHYYLKQLQFNGIHEKDIPSFDECWEQYRLHAFYAMYAFIFSGGFSDLQDSLQTKTTISRIMRAIKRIDSEHALYDLLDGKI